MQKHTKVYLNFFGYSISDWIPCEVCKSTALDIHHIIPRSRFGSKRKDEQDSIENLIALCRPCHDKAHDNKYSKIDLLEIHLNIIEKAKQKGLEI